MKKIKKITMCMLGVLFGGLALVACSGNEDKTTTNSSTPSTEVTTTPSTGATTTPSTGSTNVQTATTQK